MEIYTVENGALAETTYEYSKENRDKDYFALMNSAELAERREFWGFRARIIDEILANEPPKLDVFEEYDFGIIKVLNDRHRYRDPVNMSFLMKTNLLVFVVPRPIPLVENLKNDLLSDTGNSYITIDKILNMLFDRLTMNHFLLLDDLEREISSLEEVVIKGERRDYIKSIVTFRRKLLFLKSYYEHLLDISEELEANENGLIGEKNLRLFRILTNRVERLGRNVQNLRDYVTQVREAYQAQADISLNNIMKVLTVITAIFLPLSLIAGWYGMNFTNMPELTWEFGYPYVICLSVLVAAVFIIFFKKNKFM